MMIPLQRIPGTAEIISIGDELLIGQVVNTNASWMGEQLFANGIELNRVTTIGDSEAELHQALDNALQRVQFVFLTGGLGPTSDDITKPALCRYFGTSLVFNKEAYGFVETLFAQRGLAVTPRNREQAMLPANARVIRNNHGTASGMWFEKDGAVIVSMPGVPFEMKPMFSDLILPEVKALSQSDFFLFKTVMTTGAGESMIADRIQDWESALPPHFRLAYLPQPGIVRLRLGAHHPDKAVLEKELALQVEALCHLIPEYVYGFDEAMPEEVVGQMLAENGLTVATAESCTGGYLAHLLTSVAGSSRYFRGSVVAYDNLVKTTLLNVDANILRQHGAVSEAVAIEMARGIKQLMNVDYALSTTGIAGPDGGTVEKPVGTVWVGIAGPDGSKAICFQLGDQRDRNIRRAAIAALNILRMSMNEK